MTLTFDKSKKYDRQIRLWGEYGQFALENAKVCLIGSNGTGTEILKNLILPGVGRMTIVDDAVVTIEDLSNNFFVMEEDINKSRAEATARYLRELNEEVTVTHVDDSVESILSYNPEFFIEFSAVIACGLNNKDLINLDRLLYPENIPLVVCYSLGMIASVRVIISEHDVFDSKPDNLLTDLRLERPLILFIEFCKNQNLDTMSHKDIAHCPWLIILYKYIQLFHLKYGKFPDTYKEKCILKEMIKEGGEHYKKVSSVEGESYNESFDSFEEALKAVSTSVTKTEIPERISTILNDPRCVNINRESRPFWILMSAVREFVKNEGMGMLPLRGDIPDMTADTERYISVQRIYREEAERSAKCVENYVRRSCQTFQINVTEDLKTENISRFTKNCGNTRVLSSCSLERELKTSPTYTDDLVCVDTDELSWYLTLRASVSFYTSERRWPGEKQMNPTDSDLSHLRRLLQQDLDTCSRLKGATVKDDYLLEVCRYGGIELHSVSAFIGGIAAQEVVKLLTGLYVPIVQPLIYNAIKQTTSLIEI